MAALVQTYPQQSSTVTLLQTRPSSSSGRMPGTSQAQSGPSYMGNTQRTSYHGISGNGGGQTAYRGSTTGPVQPYAFTATPSLANNSQWQQPGYRAPGTTAPAMQQMGDQRTQQVATGSNTATRQPNGSSAQPTFAQVVAAKSSPERYRRPAPRHTDSSPGALQQQGSAMPSGSGMATVVHLYNPRNGPDRKAAVPRNGTVLPNRPHSAYGATLGTTMDDMHLHRHPNEEDNKRFRRRSIHSINAADYPNPLSPQEFKKAEEALRQEASAAMKKRNNADKDHKPVTRVVPVPPPASSIERTGSPARSGSSESLVSSPSSNSRPSSANRNSNASAPTGSPASTTSTSGEKSSSHDQPRLVNIPPRGSSAADAGKRVLNPSPLSKPATMAPEASTSDTPKPPVASEQTPTTRPATASASPKADSAAAKQLAAINEKGGKSKSKTSRLRRAFSFGSAAELRKVTGQDIGTEAKAKQNEPARLHKDQRPQDVYEEEQARIALKQEENGIGSSIYAGTKLFSGSTDNLSISSTASSASIMLRKMGRGMKKSSRSLAGLFRPKSVIGMSGEDIGSNEASHAAVSMVTVEAERDRVNVTSNEDLQQTGGTGFPHLERNSMDATKAGDSLSADRLGSSGTDNSAARKSIVGGERERAEVLATIRKGILKTRSNSPSPSTRGPEVKGPSFNLPMIPNVSDSPNSSAPSTPNDDAQSHKHNGSITIGNEDYFMSALRLRQDTNSAPTTPQGSTKRNATFSPRIVFHDTWPSGEYDRRGEIATCNRLTPMLAQQIKEELNTFKMEMEVHETSKIYTHFF
ncbi:hypothetical protein F4780DRAFT_470332 [Xylariomycetidae sp. FL0641]|nr:hypothetical protein F4780DRAFT_470332 [Xylariomycetidae sp. FL0641]